MSKYRIIKKTGKNGVEYFHFEEKRWWRWHKVGYRQDGVVLEHIEYNYESAISYVNDLINRDIEMLETKIIKKEVVWKN